MDITDTVNTCRQRKNRERELPDKRRERLSSDQNRRLRKKTTETAEEYEERLTCNREQKRRKAGTNANLQQESERPVIAVTISQTDESIATILQSEENTMTTPQSNENVEEINVEPLSSTTLSELEQEMLQKFRTKIDKFQNTLCPVCNEYFPSVVLVKGMCRWCHSEKILPKKFSAENNMDPGEIPHELEGLTEIEEMLIAQANNRYYADITIDNEVLESLPQEGYIDNQLPHLQTDQADDDLNNENDYEEVIRSFVSLLPPNNREDVAINSNLDRIEIYRTSISNFIS
ncbi:16756_t:CDS:2 [Gigaspora rosea]|nr:16756_t:CDS:2 [Gigaspora rosea]